MVGKWWENGGKMVGKWWENGGKMVGKWWENGGKMVGKHDEVIKIVGSRLAWSHDKCDKCAGDPRENFKYTRLDLS